METPPNPSQQQHQFNNTNFHLHLLQHLNGGSNSAHASPKPRPTPTFFMEQATFSTKKQKDTPKHLEVHPPRPPVKSCPPISRIKPRKPVNGARVISFLNNSNKNNDSDIITNKHYDLNKMDLYFEQCFIVEGSLGCGSFGKVSCTVVHASFTTQLKGNLWGFGKVYKVKSREDGRFYAVKKSREKFKGNCDRVRRLEEVLKHEELPPHPNCVRFYRAWEEKERLYIQIELCQMSLSKYAELHHDIPERVIWQFLVDLLQAVKHLHDRNLAHMDIKPENIFISHNGVCKLGDFGLVVDLNQNDTKEAQEGDPKYLAPEVLKGKFTLAADIFSLGMTILELATDLDVPRGGDAWHQLRTGRLPEDIKHNLSDELVAIIIQMIDPDPNTRPTASDLLKLNIVQKFIKKRKANIASKNIQSLFVYIWGLLCTMFGFVWYFGVVYPIKKLLNLNYLNGSVSNNTLLHQTSTPNRDGLKQNDLNVSLDNEEDYVDDDNEVANLQMMNDSFSTYNNSYGHPLNDTSSSFSDGSNGSSSNRIITSRKLRTEPAKLFNKPLDLFKKHSSTATTPIRTPPWKPNLKADESVAKLLGPARQKLVFDDNDDDCDGLVTRQAQDTMALRPPTLSLKVIL